MKCTRSQHELFVGFRHQQRLIGPTAVRVVLFVLFHVLHLQGYVLSVVEAVVDLVNVYGGLRRGLDALQYTTTYVQRLARECSVDLTVGVG